MNVSRTSSMETIDNFRVGSFSGSDTESDARTPQLNSSPEEKTVTGNQITNQQWQSNSIKKKLLKLFCCR